MSTLCQKTVFPSVKIPLENLLTGLMFLSSGKDKSGRILLSVDCTVCNNEPQILHNKQNDLVDMLTYFASMSSDAARALGFTVIINGASVNLIFTKSLLEAMVVFQQSRPRIFHKIFVLHAKGASVDSLIQELQEKLPLSQVDDLAEYITKDNLTSEFGGTREYKHVDWLKYRMQVEPFVSDCCSLSKRLADTVEVLTAPELPRDLSGAKTAVRAHQDQKTAVLDSLHIDQLVEEGKKLQQRMKSPSDSLKDNTDFVESTSLVGRLLSQVRSVGDRLSQLWQTKDTKLQTNLELREYEFKCQQVNDWFKLYSEEYFETNDDLGETKEASTYFLEELDKFEASSKEVVSKAETLANEATKFKGLDHIDGDSVLSVSDQLRQQVAKFEASLAARRKALKDAIKIHALTEKAIIWCLKVHSILESCVKCKPTQEIFEQKLSELQSLLSNDKDALTTEEQTELLELIEKVGSVWIKENAIFALNRISETTEKIMQYREALEKGIAEFKLKSKRKSVDNGNSSPLTEDSVDSGEALPVSRRTPDLYDEGAGLLLCEDPHKPLAEVEAALNKSLDALGAQVPTAPVLLDSEEYSLAGRKRGYTFPEAEPDGKKLTKLGRMTESFDGGFYPFFSSSKNDEADVPEEGDGSMHSQTDMAKKRRQIMTELVETEEEYVKKLGHVCENYIGELEMLEGLPGGLVGKKNIIFANIEMLYGFNRDMFLPYLQSIKQSPMKLGRVFVENEGFLMNYSWYFKNMRAQEKLMKECGAEYFAPIQKRLSDPFPLMESLILPFQRLTRYCLFLERMTKYSQPTIRGYDDLKEAYKIANFALHHGDNMLAVENLTGFSGGLIEQGLLSHQGDLTVIEGRFSSSRRRVFLFENMIIVAKKNKVAKGGTETFTYKESYKTNELGLRETINNHPLRFELWDRKKHTIVFQAESEEDKREWTDAIHDLFMEQMKRLKETQEIYQRPTSIGFGRNVRSMSMRRRTNKQTASRLSADVTALPLPRPFSQLSNISGSSDDRSHASSHISGPIPMERDSRYSSGVPAIATSTTSHYETIDPLPQDNNSTS